MMETTNEERNRSSLNKNQNVSSEENSSSNNFSRQPQVSGVRPKGIDFEPLTRSHITMTSRSINSLGINGTTRKDEEDTTSLLKSRRDSLGRTTGRRELIR